jgi:alpha-galactosidase
MVLGMKTCTRLLAASVVAALTLVPQLTKAQVPAQGPAPTPPMGWNSWDAYGLTITEPQFRANVEVLRNKLLPFGWRYAVIDEGWFFENPQDRSKPDSLRYAIDPYGRYVPVPARFPSAVEAGAAAAKASPAGASAKLTATIEPTSFVALGAWVHSQGLKFGIHIVRGIPRASVERNLPIEGSNFHAEDAADTSDTCPWDPTNWGVRDNAAGQAWYDSLLRQYASWGVDLLKVDCIANHPYKLDEIRMIRRAIDKTGRPMVLSLSPGPTALEHASEMVALANMWRIADDEWDVWDSGGKAFPQGVKDQFARLAAWEPYAGPNHWPDADMLPLGELRPHPGWGQPRSSHLTAAEQQSEVTLWAIARSPLILGANLTLLDPATLRLLTNRDLIAVSQKSTRNSQVVHEGDLIAWQASLSSGGTALAIFNLGDSPLAVERELASFGSGLGVKYWQVRDVWAQKELGRQNRISTHLPPHACVLLMLR